MLTLNKENRFQYIATLNNETQKQIRKELEKMELSEEDINLAMESKFIDLEDTIKIKYI